MDNLNVFTLTSLSKFQIKWFRSFSNIGDVGHVVMRICFLRYWTLLLFISIKKMNHS